MTTLEQERQLDELDSELGNETGDDTPPEQLALPIIDSRLSDQIELTIGGTIKLNRDDPGDCALIRRLRLGNEVDLAVSGIVVERAGRGRHNEDGYLEGTTLKTKVKVTTVRRPTFSIDDEED